MCYVSVNCAREWTECLMNRYVLINTQYANCLSILFLQCMERCFLVYVIPVNANFECQHSSDIRLLIDTLKLVKNEKEVKEMTLRVPILCIHLLFLVVISLLLSDQDELLLILKAIIYYILKINQSN